jgi:hypothetical protein
MSGWTGERWAGSGAAPSFLASPPVTFAADVLDVAALSVTCAARERLSRQGRPTQWPGYLMPHKSCV